MTTPDTTDAPMTLKHGIPTAVATIFFVAGMGMIIPGLPFLVNELGGTGADVGHVFAMYSVLSFLLAPLWGRLSDKYGRNKFLILSGLITALAYYILSISTSLLMINFARAVAGMGSAWLLVSMALIADITTSENRAKGIGMIGACFGIGFTIGVGSSGYLLGQDYSFANITIGAMISVLCASLVILFTGREPNKMQATERKLLDISIFDNKMIAGVLIAHLCLQLLFTGMEGTFSLWGKEKQALTARDVSYMLGVSGIVGIIIQGALVGRLCRRYGEPKIILWGIVLLGIAFVTFVTSAHIIQTYIGMALFGASMALYAPSIQSYVSLNTAEDEQGVAMGSVQSMASLARIGGPLWAGYLYDFGGMDMPYMVSALLVIPLLIYFVRLFNKNA